MSVGNDRDDLRNRVAAQVAAKLPPLLGKAFTHDSGALATMARLRRGVGVPFGGDGVASSELLKLIELPAGWSPVSREGEPTSLGRLLDDAYLVVTLVAFTRVAVRKAEKGPSTFGRDFRRCRLRRQKAEHLAERLMQLILRSRREELDRHLRRAFALLAYEDLHVDAGALVRELGYWEDDREWVQKRWAYDFWAGSEAESDEDSQIEMTEGVRG